MVCFASLRSALSRCLKPPGIVLWPLLTSRDRPFSTATANIILLRRVREISPGTHTFFPSYTCPVYCWRSVQLLDFSLFSDLIHAFQPIRTSFTGQRFASVFLQTPPRDDALDLGCILPTAGRIWDFHPLDRALAGHTEKAHPPLWEDELFCVVMLSWSAGLYCFILRR